MDFLSATAYWTGFFKLCVSHHLFHCAKQRANMIPSAVRGGGFSIVVFDRLPQGLVILYGMFCSARHMLQHLPRTITNKNCHRVDDGKNINIRKPRLVTDLPFSSIFLPFQCQLQSGTRHYISSGEISL